MDTEMWVLPILRHHPGTRQQGRSRVRLKVCHDDAMSESYAGKLLVAGPDLLDPNFARSVVLICLHDDAGAFGLVLNRPLAAAVVDHLPAWAEWASHPASLFSGGPVDPTAVVGLGRTR